MNKRFLDLISLWAIIVIVELLALTGVGGLVLLFFILPLVFVYPGYCLLVALLPEKNFVTLEKLPIILGTSIALTAMTGFTLNLTPWGLQAVSWAVGLGITNLILSIAALVQRQKIPDFQPARLNIGLKPQQWVMLLLAGIIVTSAIVISYQGSVNQNVANFTQFWMLPKESQATNNITVGIKNTEQKDITYRVEVMLESKVVQSWQAIPLKPGEKWEMQIEKPPSANEKSKIVALLYRADKAEGVYRRVELLQ